MADVWNLYPGGIDVVVNNAGYILSGMLEELTTNFHGPLNITRALLPKLRAKGAVECLSKELAIVAPGLKVLNIEPGYSRTRAFSNVTHVPDRVETYTQLNAGVRQFEQSVVCNEPGDSAKAVDILIGLVKGTGAATNKAVPLRVPLGSDGLERIKAKCQDQETVTICDDWEEVARSIDIKP